MPRPIDSPDAFEKEPIGHAAHVQLSAPPMHDTHALRKSEGVSDQLH